MSKTDDIVKLLPEAISLVFASCDRTFFNGIREIHLRVGAPMLVCVCTGNYFLSSNGKPSPCPTGIIITKELLKETVKRLCCGSVYTYEKTIRQGYIPMDGGYRIGVAGELLHSDCGLCVGDITSINIRIPHTVGNVSHELLQHFSQVGLHGVLVYSPPGGGKTTLLRDLAGNLAFGSMLSPKKVAIADERKEFGKEGNLALCDVYSGYPKEEAIEFATRTMAPDVIICDEIGAINEAQAILNVQSTGVPLIASVHAQSKAELYARPPIKLLLEAGIFPYTYSLTSKRLEKL